MSEFSPVLISAQLSAGLAVNDDYSPDLGAVLEYCWLVSNNLFSTNPDPHNLIEVPLPIEKQLLGDDWQWAISSPCYNYVVESVERCRKRWDADSIHPVNWSSQRANVQTNGGPFKSADVPVSIRITSAVHWYAVGNPTAIERLLGHAPAIGQRRGAGYGQVWRWTVSSTEADWTLTRDGQLMRPIPVRLAEMLHARPTGRLQRWNTKAPRWDKTNAELCFMPEGLVGR